jgi:dihydroorotase-like cyclic amidohydrolase
MTVDLVIRDGQVVTPGGIVAGGVAIDGERVVAVGADGTLPAARRTIDARGQYVMPGLIDAHVHMGSEEDASIAEGLAQNMPGETVWGLGVTSFNHFFNAYKPRPTEGLSWLGGPSDAGMLLRSLRFCAERGAPGICLVRCEDIDVIAVLEDQVMATGRTDLGAWSEARPSVAEYSRVALAIDLAKAARASIYIAHLSTAESAESRCRRPAGRLAGLGGGDAASPDAYRGDGGGGGCWGKVNPPLRTAADVERLWRAFHDGGVTCLDVRGPCRARFHRGHRARGRAQHREGVRALSAQGSPRSGRRRGRRHR